jgi:cell division protease FtsH
MAKKTTPSSRIDLAKKTKPAPAEGGAAEARTARFKRPNWLAIVFLALIAIALSIGFWRTDEKTVTNDEIGINAVVANYQSGAYSEVAIRDGSVSATRKEVDEQLVAGRVIRTKHVDKAILPPYDTLADLGLNDPKNPTKVEVQKNVWGNFLVDFLPTLLLIVAFGVAVFFLIGRMGGMGGGPMGFMRSRAKIYEPNEKDKVTFADIAGAAEEKEDLVEVVDFLKNPKKYERLGAKIPRGILMAGPPGTGKTLLARAVAGESNVPFFSMSGSEFVEMFVGVGAARVRDLFREAKEKAPAIIFIDEIDAIGKRRAHGMGGGHEEREQTLNQILTEMDGFDNDTHVIVLAATNRADVLDRALLRPGRFDRKVNISLPNLEDRLEILKIHAREKPLDKSVDLHSVASSTVGFSGADLANLVNEAAILAGREDAKTITQEHLQKSIEKVLMGNARKSMRMTDHEKKIIAYHEVGHALVGKMLANTDPVHKLSILSRGRALGVTWFLPEKDRVLVSKAKFRDEIVSLYGGRVAEEVFFGQDQITTGASNDIERATDMARDMIMRYGFDDELGPENLASKAVEGNYLGYEGESLQISGKTHELVDAKVRELLKNAYAAAKKIVLEHRDLHVRIAERLLEKEEILKEEFDAFFASTPNVPEKFLG